MVKPPQRGFVYMALIVFFGVLAVFAAYTMMSGAQLQRRNAEDQLIFVGGEFRRAIESYYNAAADLPPGASRYPARLEDLLADPRQKNLARYLRQLYPDPLTGRREWNTVQAPGGGIMGVYSKSPAKAVKLFGFPPEFKYLEGKTKIADWQFVYVPPVLPDLPVPAAAQAPAAPVNPFGAAQATGNAGAAPAGPSAAVAASPAPAAPASGNAAPGNPTSANPASGQQAPADAEIDEAAIDRAVNDILSGKSKGP